MFKKDQDQTTLTVSTEAYRRWLRAQRPDFQFFFACSEMEQEHLAQIGDQHTEEMVVAMGYAINDPEGSDAAVSAGAGQSRGEEVLTMRLMDSLAQSIIQRRQQQPQAQPAAKPPLSMAGAVRSPTVQRRPIDQSAPRPVMREFLGAKKKETGT
jgi:hypothetical protein